MQKKHISFLVAAAAALAFSAASPAHAQNVRTWVSGTGDDFSAACARNAPCKTFAGAIGKTNSGGEINCVDSGSFGQVTINKSITIDCSGTNASILSTSGNGITINTDVQAGMIVRLRNININGTLTGGRGIWITGANGTDNAISIEECVVDGFVTFGIANNARAGRFLIKNTVVRNNHGTAVSIGAPPAISTVRATLDNVTTFDSGYGFAFGNGAQAVVKNSIASNHVTAGVQADPGGTVSVVSSVIVGNVTGILATAGSTIRVRDSDIASNITGVSGTIQSHVNNSFINNGAGGTITPVAGGVTNPQGLQ